MNWIFRMVSLMCLDTVGGKPSLVKCSWITNHYSVIRSRRTIYFIISTGCCIFQPIGSNLQPISRRNCRVSPYQSQECISIPLLKQGVHLALCILGLTVLIPGRRNLRKVYGSQLPTIALKTSSGLQK